MKTVKRYLAMGFALLVFVSAVTMLFFCCRQISDGYQILRRELCSAPPEAKEE